MESIIFLAISYSDRFSISALVVQSDHPGMVGFLPYTIWKGLNPCGDVIMEFFAHAALSTAS